MMVFFGLLKAARCFLHFFFFIFVLWMHLKLALENHAYETSFSECVLLSRCIFFF